MPYYFGDSYSGVAANRQAGDAQATQDYFNYARMLQGLDQQGVENQRAQDVANAQAGRFSFERAQALAGLGLNTRAQNLAEQKFAWDKTQVKLGEKKLAEEDSKAMAATLLPLADEGTLTDEQMVMLQEPHKQALKARRDAARQVIEKTHNELKTAADLVNQTAMFKNRIAAAEADRPHNFENPFAVEPFIGPIETFQKSRRMQQGIDEWNKQLKELEKTSLGPEHLKAVTALPIDPDNGFRVVPPLPWEKSKATAATTPKTLPPHIQQSLENARKAIAANPAAKVVIMKRLADNGIDPNLL